MPPAMPSSICRVFCSLSRRFVRRRSSRSRSSLATSCWTVLILLQSSGGEELGRVTTRNQNKPNMVNIFHCGEARAKSTRVFITESNSHIKCCQKKCRIIVWHLWIQFSRRTPPSGIQYTHPPCTLLHCNS